MINYLAALLYFLGKLLLLTTAYSMDPVLRLKVFVWVVFNPNDRAPAIQEILQMPAEFLGKFKL